MSYSFNQNEESITLFSEKKIKYLLNISNQSEYLLIDANAIELIPSTLYKGAFTLDEIKLNKYFKICDSIEDVIFELKNIFKNNLNNIKISEETNKLILTIPLPSYLIKEVNFNLDIFLKNEKEEIIDLYKTIGMLYQKIKELEEKNLNPNNNKTINQNLEERIIELEKKNKIIEDELKKEKELNKTLKEELKKRENNINEELKKIKDYLFPESIFNSKIKFDEKLVKEWIGKKFKAELLFRFTRDGSEPKEFHRLCDNKGPTIIFIETIKDIKFGGYTELEWDKSSSFKTDEATFLFSFNNKTKYTRRNNMCSIYCREDLAPSFGGNGNPDFFCMGSCKKGELCDKNTFATPKELNNGETSFTVKEMEVYQIILI